METFKNKILTKLNDSSVDLSTRCHIAHGTFISSSPDFQLINKEELVLEWIAKYPTKSADDYSSFLQLLLKCLRSQHLQSFVKVISPESCLKFLKKAKKYTLDLELQTHIRDCTKLMMTLACFQLHFKNDVNALAKAISIHYSTIAVCGHHESDTCETSSELLLQLYNEIMLKDDFVIQFLDTMMPAIFSISEPICKCSTSNNMYKLMNQMFFKDARAIAEMSSLEKYITEPSFLATGRPVIQALVHTLTQSVVTNNENAMATFFSSFLSLFIKKTKTCVFKLFICLCSALGFKPEHQSIRLEHKLDCQKGLKILLAMLNQLQISKVSPVVNESNEMFFDWLTSLLKLVMSPAYGISTYVLSIIQSVLNFVPVIFSLVIPQFVEYIMIPLKDNSVSQLYALTLNSVMDIFQKLTRLDKLFDVMIETISLLSKKNPALLPPCSVMLPLEFKLNFEKLVEEMSTSQCLKSVACLLNHLNREIAEPLAVSNERIEVGQLALLEFITVILDCLLRNIKTTSFGQPSNYYHLLAKMANILNRIGQAMLKQIFNLKLTDLFFKLSRVWGDCVLIIKNYDNTNNFDNVLMDHNVPSFQIMNDSPALNTWTDISYTFKFLNSEEWNFIAQRVHNFASEGSKDDFCTMVIQNLNSLKLTDNLTESKISLTQNSLFSVASPKWLWRNLYQYISFIDETSALQLVKVLVDPEKTDSLSHFEKICVLQDLNGKEGRMLIVLLGLGWLRNVGQVLNRFGMDKTQSLLKNIETEEFVVVAELVHGTFFDSDSPNDDNDHDVDDVTMAKIKVKNYGDVMPKSFMLDFNETRTVGDIDENGIQQIQSLLDLIYALKITGLSPASCKLILFGALSILRELSQQSRKPPQLLFTIISEILMKNIYLVGDMWLSNEFFQWLYNTYKDQPQRKVIFSLACDFVVKKHNVSADLIESLTSNLEIAPLLMSAYIKQQQSSKRKREGSEEEVQITKQNLENCMKVVKKVLKQLISADGVQTEQLYAFSLFLKHSMHMKSVKRIEWCSKHLPAFYNCVLLNVSDPLTTDISNELVFIETVFSNWSMFRGKLKQSTHIELWKALSTKATLCSSCMHILLEAFNIDEYVDVLETTRKETIKNNTMDKNLIYLDKVWKVIVTAKVNSEKIKKRLSYKDFLECEFSSLAAKWVTNSPDASSVKAVFNILTAIVKTPTIRIGPENLDIMFLLMSVLPPNDFEVLNIGFNLLGNLLTKRSSIIMMHLPSYLQRYRFLITCVVKASSEEVPETKLMSLYKCTNVIEQLALAMTNHKAELVPNVPNIVADIIHLFEIQTINLIVKRSLINTLNTFLTICSQKSVDYLMLVLSPASKEIFKNVYKNYNKFHRYHGKI